MVKYRSSVVSLILTLAILGITGCAVNQFGIPGLVSLEYAENDHAYRTQIEAWGIHLSTDPMDRGLAFGYTKRIYVRPKLTVIDLEFTDYIAGLFEENWRPAPPGNETISGATAILNKTMGIAIQTNRHAIGAMLGLSTIYRIEVEIGYDGIIAVNLGKE